MNKDTKKALLDALSEAVELEVNEVVLLDDKGKKLDTVGICASLRSAIEKEVWDQLILSNVNSSKLTSTTFDHV